MPQEISSLSDAALRSLKPTGSRYEVTDKVSRGLIGRVSSSGAVTFILRARDAGGTVKTVTLGTYPDMSLKAARDAANRVRLDLKSGRNVNAEKKAVREIALTEQDKTTLHTIIAEYEQYFAPQKASWRQRGPRTDRSGARQVIERVYAPLLDRPIMKITDEDFARAVTGYKRLRPTDGRSTANGQASRARAYLSPVLDWAAGRKSFSKLGASRSPRLPVATLSTTHDPATDDPTIVGKRTRVLREAELAAILPLLTYPAQKLGSLRLEVMRDFRPIAMRFMLYTAARLEEVCSMKWRDIDRTN